MTSDITFAGVPLDEATRRVMSWPRLIHALNELMDEVTSEYGGTHTRWTDDDLDVIRAIEALRRSVQDLQSAKSRNPGLDIYTVRTMLLMSDLDYEIDATISIKRRQVGEGET